MSASGMGRGRGRARILGLTSKPQMEKVNKASELELLRKNLPPIPANDPAFGQEAWRVVVKLEAEAQKNQTKSGQTQDHEGGQNYQPYAYHVQQNWNDQSGLASQTTAALASTYSIASVSQSKISLVNKPSNAKGSKTNGYCLFLKHKARETGKIGSINDLMGIFDKDWKSLPEEEKKEWKLRAKSGDGRT